MLIRREARVDEMFGIPEVPDTPVTDQMKSFTVTRVDGGFMINTKTVDIHANGLTGRVSQVPSVAPSLNMVLEKVKSFFEGK